MATPVDMVPQHIDTIMMGLQHVTTHHYTMQQSAPRPQPKPKMGIRSGCDVVFLGGIPRGRGGTARRWD
eukprot:gene47298-16811_t